MSAYQNYIDAGFRIFGIYGATDGHCECGDPECTALFKHPRMSNWQHTPEWSDEQLEVMESAGVFATGIGVLVTDWLIIDIDARNGGVESFSKLCAALGMDLLGESEFVVNTGSGNGSMHLYFSAPEGVALRQSLPEYAGLDFKSSGYVVGLGSRHASGTNYTLRHGAPDSVTNAPAALIDLLRKPEVFRTSANGATMDVTEQDIAAMLDCISPDCDYDTWLKIGMSTHQATNGTGFNLYDMWSAKGEGYPGRPALERKWHSFGKSSNPVTIGTLIFHAEQGGYQQPVSFEYAEAPAAVVEKGDHPFSIASVDLLRPPGFVGQVSKWIDSQCRYPREHLAVAASLVGVGNAAGLRYTDDIDGVTCNLFGFCVAGSATGKEAVQQAMAEVHRATGIQAATHGSIKSEQEIVRNLIRHQAALYIIDEIGILLAKVVNAQKKGGAAYLDGVIGMLMAAYSKADSYMLLTGDTKEDVRKTLIGELSQARKSISENEDKNGIHQRRLPQLERALANLDNGLERPFLSMIGFTTPVTFEDLVTYEQATNGFIGRSLLIKERETNPRARRKFRKEPMTSQMRAALQNLYQPGQFDAMTMGRVEHYGDKVRIKTEPAAQEMMSSVLDWLEDYAEAHKGQTGLEAIVRRGYEMMAKVSLILAVPEGMRTTEHVRWAYAIMRRDIDEKITLAYSNMNARQDPAMALMAKITTLVDHDHGESMAVIRNRCRPAKREDVDKALSLLMDAGQLVEHIVTSRDGKKTSKLFKA